MGRIFGWVASSLRWPARLGNTLCNYMSSVIALRGNTYTCFPTYV